MPAQTTTRKKNRKWGRNKTYCDNYRSQLKHERSHARRMWAHLRRHPGDGVCRDRLSKLPLTALEREKIPIDQKRWPKPPKLGLWPNVAQ